MRNQKRTFQDDFGIFLSTTLLLALCFIPSFLWAQTPPVPPRADVSENLGDQIPLDLEFTDSTGKTRQLSDFLDKPALLIPVFFHCPNVCPIMLGNIANAVKAMGDNIGANYRIIAFSFDETDDSHSAARIKQNYLPVLPEEFDPESWLFLSGSLDNIKKLTQAIGFSFYRQGEYQFIHPTIAVAISPSGKIIRYLYGPEFLPFDISMALAEAEKNTPSVSIKKILTFCFAYDPGQKKYVFRTFRVFATLTLILIGLFYFFILRKGNKRS